uniref:(northern house mosquito) hypothetical protein n=1 Tax=Culex pipiens TaxID=7175 RepID=A0A8D8DJC0_CULPI
MEIQTIVFESWMCRICLGQGSVHIFEDHLLPPPPATLEQTSTAVKTQGRGGCSPNAVSIVDALNYFCEFKISPSEIVNEPTMLCEGCCAALLQAYQFRIKLNEAECLLRSRDGLDGDDADDATSTKTGLTLQLEEIEPFLDDPSPVSEEVVPPAKPPKIHHAKPRFQLTNQVSNILRHVAASSGSEKRKELDEPSLDSSTPKKIPRRSEDSGHLNQTLIVPNYIFANEIDEDGRADKTILLVEPVAVSTSNLTPPEPPEGYPSIAYCKHCPKAFSSPQHLLAHTKSTHLCQHCLRHLPTAADRNRHVREEHTSFRCTLCSTFQTSYAANLRTHLRRTHAVALPAHVSILQQPSVPDGPEEIPAGQGPQEGNK